MSQMYAISQLLKVATLSLEKNSPHARQCCIENIKVHRLQDKRRVEIKVHVIHPQYATKYENA